MPGPFVATENRKLSYNLVWDVGLLAWVVMTQPGGGSGSGDVNLIEVGGDAIALGQTTMADSFPVVLASDHSPIEVTGDFSSDGLTDAELRASPVEVDVTNTVDVNVLTLPNEGQQTMANSISVAIASDQSAIPVTVSGGAGQTDTEARATQTNSGLLDGNGDTVVLELNGATNVCALFPDAGTFNGTVVFEVSSDGGVEYNHVQANARSDFGPSGSGINPSNSEWIFALGGGETHARVRVTAFTGGSSTVTLTGTYTQNDAIQNVMAPAGGGNIPRASVLIAGRFGGTEVHSPRVRADDDGKTDMAWVVRDMQGGFRVGGGMTGASDFGKGIGGIDDADVFQFVEMRDATPAGTEFGVVTRPIVGTLPLPTGAATLAEQQTQTTHLATIAGDTTAIETAVQIMDDWDESDRAKVNPIVGQAGVQGGAGASTALTQRVAIATDANAISGTVTANQGGAPWLQRFNPSTSSALTEASINAASSGDNTIVSATGGQTIRIHKLFFVVASDVDLIFKDGAATGLTGTITMKGSGAVTLDFDAEPWFTTSTGNAFVINLSSAVQISGRAYYTKS